MKSPIFPGETLVFDGLFANGAVVGGTDYVAFACGISRLFGFQPIIQLANVFEEVGQAFLTVDLAFELECTLEANADKELEVVGEPSNERQKFLCHTESPNASLL